MVVLLPRHEKEEDEKSHYDWPTSLDDNQMPVPTLSSSLDGNPFANNPYNSQTGSPSFPTSIPKPWESWTRGPSESTPTSSYSSWTSPISEYAEYSSSPTLVSHGVPDPTSTSSGGYGGVDPSQKESEHSGHGGLYAAAGLVPVAVLAFIAVIVFLYLRKRKRQRKQAGVMPAHVQEMKDRPTSTVQPYLSAPPTAQPLYANPPSHPPPTGPISPQPVILGPIVPNSNGAYFTGIDTSDIVSVNDRATNDRTGLGNPFVDTSSLNEEPPPPYRPRSIAPLSRDTSVRTSIAPLSRDTSFRAPPSASSRTNLIGRPQRSPFADPDDDTVSNLSGPTTGRGHDASSVVSGLSYQEDPTTTRPSV